MHKTFVATAPPPTVKGGDHDKLSVPCYKPNPQGANNEVKTLQYKISLGLGSYCQPVISPTLQRHSKSNCPALWPSLPLPFPVGGGRGQWLQMTGAITIELGFRKDLLEIIVTIVDRAML